MYYINHSTGTLQTHIYNDSSVIAAVNPCTNYQSGDNSSKSKGRQYLAGYVIDSSLNDTLSGTDEPVLFFFFKLE